MFKKSARLTIMFSWAVAVIPCLVVRGWQDSDATARYSPAIEKRLAEAGENRGPLLSALAGVKHEHRRALEFLIEHMPQTDLTTLPADFLIDNVELAYEALDQVPWGKQIPEEMFFNNILPYANVDETREAWRREMMQRCLPLIQECKTAGEAAQKLNRELFPLIKVRYSTSRKKANQSPGESMEQSVASCTGLSILLSDACRSVGIPSRLAGTPGWTKKRGNHTWVEIWDGQWFFTGAAEPAAQGLNHSWFTGDASMADDSKPMNRIYAASFASTGMYFPLVWAPRNRQIPAVNVTHRYVADRPAIANDRTRVLIGVRDASGKRVERDVAVAKTGEPDSRMTGRTRNETADTNDLLTMVLERNQMYEVSWLENGTPVTRQKKTGAKEQVYWEFQLERRP